MGSSGHTPYGANKRGPDQEIKMKYLRKIRQRLSGYRPEDPLQGVSNLFDVALVFIVGLFLALMSTYQILDFFNPESEITIMKKSGGEWKIITKKGKEIKVRKITDRKVGGMEGLRLGTAYQLKNGRVIYVPESMEEEKAGERQ